MTLLIAMVPAFAGQASLLLGTWTIDVSKLNIPNPEGTAHEGRFLDACEIAE